MSQPGGDTDWTGLGPDTSPVEPLDARTFVARLRLLSERAEGLTILREAMAEQHSRGEQLPRRSQPVSRSPR